MDEMELGSLSPLQRHPRRPLDHISRRISTVLIEGFKQTALNRGVIVLWWVLMWCGSHIPLRHAYVCMYLYVCVVQLIKEAVYVRVHQWRSAQSSEVQLSQTILAVRSKRGCNYPEPVISGGRLGFGECVPLLHTSALFTLQPSFHLSSPAKGHFFSWSAPTAIPEWTRQAAQCPSQWCV